MSLAGSLPKQKSFIVDSIFESEINEFNQNIAFFLPQDTLINLFGSETLIVFEDYHISTIYNMVCCVSQKENLTSL